mmetsp:Transcript_74895/g.219400  ORF Transcript_74895/g.219400 Transcript_74895/m.219400 type:complete len:88 (-) Transcript_74895:516-779(-)
MTLPTQMDCQHRVLQSEDEPPKAEMCIAAMLLHAAHAPMLCPWCTRQEASACRCALAGFMNLPAQCREAELISEVVLTHHTHTTYIH